MKLKYINIDETYMISGNLLEKLQGGKVYSSYLFNEESYTYLCELTPSYELHLIDTYAVPSPGEEFSEEDSEYIWEQIRPQTDNSVTYMHVSDVNKKNPKVISYNEEDSFEEILENCIANCGSYQI